MYRHGDGLLTFYPQGILRATTPFWPARGDIFLFPGDLPARTDARFRAQVSLAKGLQRRRMIHRAALRHQRTLLIGDLLMIVVSVLGVCFTITLGPLFITTCPRLPDDRWR
jgi:hypothetical protein